jgi:hypothetical protein
MEQCFEHQAIKANTAMIPGLASDVAEIKAALLGTMDRPGWLGRVATLEKSMSVIVRVSWGVIGFVGLGVGTALWALIVK